MDNPTVFISYSHDNLEHEQWVMKLATDLRSHGVNAILDQWDLRLGSDLRFFMEQGLSESALVLCICSQKYVEKFNNGTSGVGYEALIMTQDLLKNAKKDYIISIIRNNDSETKVPLALGSKLYIDFSEDNQYISKYQELLERIYSVDCKKKPPLGKNPFTDDLGQRIALKTKMESIHYHSPKMDGKVIFRFDNNNGIYTIGNGEYTFNTHWSRSGNDSIHAYGKIGYRYDQVEIPDMAEIDKFDFSSNTRTVKTGNVIIVENENYKFAAIKLGKIKSAGHGYPFDEMEFEYHIYIAG